MKKFISIFKINVKNFFMLIWLTKSYNRISYYFRNRIFDNSKFQWNYVYRKQSFSHQFWFFVLISFRQRFRFQFRCSKHRDFSQMNFVSNDRSIHFFHFRFRSTMHRNRCWCRFQTNVFWWNMTLFVSNTYQQIDFEIRFVHKICCIVWFVKRVCIAINLNRSNSLFETQSIVHLRSIVRKHLIDVN